MNYLSLPHATTTTTNSKQYEYIIFNLFTSTHATTHCLLRRIVCVYIVCVHYAQHARRRMSNVNI